MAGSKFSQGWKGQLGVGAQLVALDAPVAPTIFQDLGGSPDVSLKEERPGKDLLSGVRGGFPPRMVSVKRGVFTVTGGFGAPIYPDDLFNGLIWALIYGNNQFTSGDVLTGFAHLFKEPLQESDFPQCGATVQVNIGQDGNVKLRDFVGCFLNKVTLTVPEDDVITLATEWVGREEQLGGTLATPSYTAVSPFEGWMANLKIGDTLGTAVNIEFTDLTLERTVNVVMVQQKLNRTRFPVGRTYGIADTTLSFNLKAKDDTSLQALFKSDTPQAVELLITHTSDAGTNPSTPYTMKFEGEQMEIFDAVDNLDNIQDINQPIILRAFGENSRVTLVNSVAGAYAV
jgi:hypothetical protein